jgi:hypothetical protein
MCGIIDLGHTCNEYLVLLAKSGMTEVVPKPSQNPLHQPMACSYQPRGQSLPTRLHPISSLVVGGSVIEPPLN